MVFEYPPSHEFELTSDHQNVEVQPIVFGLKMGLVEVGLKFHSPNICRYI